MTHDNLSRRAVLAFAGSVAFVVVATSVQAQISVLSAPQAHAAAGRGDILMIDVRRPDEWAATGSGEYAVRIDMRDDDFITQVRAARVSPDQPVAVICAHGVRSQRMTRLLETSNIGPIVDVTEGMLGSDAGPGWIARGLPVVY